MNNQLKTVLFLGALSALLVAIGGAISPIGMWIMIGFAIVMNLGAYFFSDKMVLRMSRARVVTEAEAPALYALVHDLADRAGLPMPKLAIVPDATPNAFATGRNPNHAVVAVTEGLLRLVDPRELRGVIAHELGHVVHRDILVASIAATVTTVITSVASMLRWGAMFGGISRNDDREGGLLGVLAMALLAPMAALMLQLGISRSREYLADDFAGRLTGDPRALASALQRLQGQGERLFAHGAAVPTPATLSLSIVNPLSGKNLFRLFASHPPIEDRVQHLLALEAELQRGV